MRLSLSLKQKDTSICSGKQPRRACYRWYKTRASIPGSLTKVKSKKNDARNFDLIKQYAVNGMI